MNEAVTELSANINQYQNQIKESKEIEKTNKQKTNDIEYKIKNAAEIKKKEQKVRFGPKLSSCNEGVWARLNSLYMKVWN